MNNIPGSYSQLQAHLQGLVQDKKKEEETLLEEEKKVRNLWNFAQECLRECPASITKNQEALERLKVRLSHGMSHHDFEKCKAQRAVVDQAQQALNALQIQQEAVERECHTIPERMKAAENALNDGKKFLGLKKLFNDQPENPAELLRRQETLEKRMLVLQDQIKSASKKLLNEKKDLESFEKEGRQNFSQTAKKAKQSKEELEKSLDRLVKEQEWANREEGNLEVALRGKQRIRREFLQKVKEEVLQEIARHKLDAERFVTKSSQVAELSQKMSQEFLEAATLLDADISSLDELVSEISKAFPSERMESLENSDTVRKTLQEEWELAESFRQQASNLLVLVREGYEKGVRLCQGAVGSVSAYAAKENELLIAKYQEGIAVIEELEKLDSPIEFLDSYRKEPWTQISLAIQDLSSSIEQQRVAYNNWLEARELKRQELLRKQVAVEQAQASTLDEKQRLQEAMQKIPQGEISTVLREKFRALEAAAQVLDDLRVRCLKTISAALGDLDGSTWPSQISSLESEIEDADQLVETQRQSFLIAQKIYSKAVDYDNKRTKLQSPKPFLECPTDLINTLVSEEVQAEQALCLELERAIQSQDPPAIFENLQKEIDLLEKKRELCDLARKKGCIAWVVLEKKALFEEKKRLETLLKATEGEGLTLKGKEVLAAHNKLCAAIKKCVETARAGTSLNDVQKLVEKKREFAKNIQEYDSALALRKKAEASWKLVELERLKYVGQIDEKLQKITQSLEEEKNIINKMASPSIQLETVKILVGLKGQKALLNDLKTIEDHSEFLFNKEIFEKKEEELAQNIKTINQRFDARQQKARVFQEILNTKLSLREVAPLPVPLEEQVNQLAAPKEMPLVEQILFGVVPPIQEPVVQIVVPSPRWKRILLFPVRLFKAIFGREKSVDLKTPSWRSPVSLIKRSFQNVREWFAGKR